MREIEREKVGPQFLYSSYYFQKSSFWYLKDINPGEREIEREEEIK